jgi:peptidoglycan/LPS O-acetylase OafA/YrhL
MTQPVGAREDAGSAGRLMRLEYLRGAASFYIFLHHYVWHNLPEYRDLLVRFFVFGQLAVLLFFLLSGFVVHYATLGQDPHMSFRSYFVRRFRRIFPIFGVALGVAYAAACILAGRWVDPSLGELSLNLLQLQDRSRAGNWVEPYMNNTPLWSLSYEWWFYMWYFAVHLVCKQQPYRQKYVVLGIATVGFVSDVLWPNPLSHVASYLVLWWFGVELAREYLNHGNVTFKNQWFGVASILVLTALWSLPVTPGWDETHIINWYEHPGLTFRHFLSVALLIVVGWAWYKIGLVGFDRLFGIFRWVAPVSYALYVVHFPLLLIFAHFGGSGALAFLYIAPSILLFSWILEQPLQSRINRLFRPTRKAKPQRLELPSSSPPRGDLGGYPLAAATGSPLRSTESL